MADGRQTVAGAYARMDAHDELCAERYKNIHGRIDQVLKAVEADQAASALYRKERRQEEAEARQRQEEREQTVRNWLIGLLLTIVGWMAVQLYLDLKTPPAAPAVSVITPAPAAAAPSPSKP